MDSPVAHQNLDNEIKSSCEHIEELEKIANKFQEEAKTKIKIKDKKGAQTTLIKKKRYVKQINNYRGDLELFRTKEFDKLGKTKFSFISMKFKSLIISIYNNIII